MIYRALDKSIMSLDKDLTVNFLFADKNLIGSWALDAMKFAYKNQIMKGLGNNLIGPTSNTTREQAVVLLKRTYVIYSGTELSNIIKGTIPIYKSTPIFTTEQNKYKQMNIDNVVFPKYDERVKLFVASTSTKPASKPLATNLILFKTIPSILTTSETKSTYVNSSYFAFIDKNETSI